MTKYLYLIRGIPGSGKSKLAEIIIEGFIGIGYYAGVKHIEADDFFINKYGDYEFVPASIPKAHIQCQERCKEAMKKEYKYIIISNTFTEEWQLKWYRKAASFFGYTIIELVCLSNFKSEHNVPEETVVQMRYKLGRDLYSRLITE